MNRLNRLAEHFQMVGRAISDSGQDPVPVLALTGEHADLLITMSYTGKEIDPIVMLLVEQLAYPIGMETMVLGVSSWVAPDDEKYKGVPLASVVDTDADVKSALMTTACDVRTGDVEAVVGIEALDNEGQSVWVEYKTTQPWHEEALAAFRVAALDEWFTEGGKPLFMSRPERNILIDSTVHHLASQLDLSVERFAPGSIDKLHPPK